MDELPCQEIDPELFFSTVLHDRVVAVNACRRCPKQEMCLQTGMQTRSSGIWGGQVLVDGRLKVRESRAVAA